MNDPSPEAVVQRQFEAYNARDVEALLATYAADARQYEHPSTLLASGAEAIGRRMAERFRDPLLHARLLHRIVHGSLVIDHEEITRTLPEGPGTMRLVAMYEVREGRIANAWFLFGAPATRAP